MQWRRALLGPVVRDQETQWRNRKRINNQNNLYSSVAEIALSALRVLRGFSPSQPIPDPQPPLLNSYIRSIQAASATTGGPTRLRN